MPRISSGRFTPSDITAGLGLLAALAGTWKGHGFNLIARPDFHDKTDLYLQLNHTRETLILDPIGSVIPNRGFGQDDIPLFGLTYLQKISDAGHDGALHIEPGIWITQPDTTFPPESIPGPAQLVARMGTIPHGNSLLAEGIAEPFTGPPVLKIPGSEYSFSKFPSFNSTPFGVPPNAPGVVFNAAGSSEKLTIKAPATPFPQYDLSIPPAPTPLPPPLQAIFNLNTRTPYETVPPEPPILNTPQNQALVNDPIVFLQNDIQKLVNEGYTFKGTALNIATQRPVTFLATANIGAGGPTVPVDLPQFGGGIENIQFLVGETVTVGGNPQPEENAQTAIVYATFWIETATNENTGHSFMQLQYAQMVLLDFPIFHLLNPAQTVPPTPPAFVNLGWPHISVATLRKTFG
ncbi:hypothetical protein EOS_37585 [Caballeronia mineralivorans PML1(12)]|uniref:Uncharacterized protein n=1 Tax=Caballeronia mineralivorans PML1(12) TaxID=908627 RepID=A0A0J1CKF7_9BURK|nr:heme-binding protein [Caballeronia mineralivorans]KLU21197.1 hypothetical protein EOS_37585 [Caballeronia mineralivorans PML1(12)]